MIILPISITAKKPAHAYESPASIVRPVLPAARARRHDITKDELEKGEYDLAHCRFLLMHMAEPEMVLRRMVDALRPGGWLVVEDHDLGFQLSCDVVDPSLAPLASTYRVMFDCLRKMWTTSTWTRKRTSFRIAHAKVCRQDKVHRARASQD